MENYYIEGFTSEDLKSKKLDDLLQELKELSEKNLREVFKDISIGLKLNENQLVAYLISSGELGELQDKYYNKYGKYENYLFINELAKKFLKENRIEIKEIGHIYKEDIPKKASMVLNLKYYTPR